MIVDTSVILAIFFNEKHSLWATEYLNAHAAELRMSTVSLTETLIRLQDRQPTLFSELRQRLLNSGIRFIPPDIRQAQIAAEARLKFPLNLGDCFVYGLAIIENCSILTLDKDFKSVDHPVILPPES